MEELKQKLEKYFGLTRKALEKVKLHSDLTEKQVEQANDLLDLSKRYYEDALHFEDKNDLVNAFGAVCYSHAFLDIGARIGLFDVDDNQLFMVD